MIDLHTHTLFSDGVLVPSELARRAEVKGYKAIAFTDHVDHSNLDHVLESILKVCEVLNKQNRIHVIPGVEITHVAPQEFEELASRARTLGARIVVAHGETPVEPVAPGTNRAAIDAGVDIVAHPGLITEEEVSLAVKKGVCLEITARRGHSLTNGHVAAMAMRLGGRLVCNTDAHEPKDLVDQETAKMILTGAGLSSQGVSDALMNSEELLKRVTS